MGFHNYVLCVSLARIIFHSRTAARIVGTKKLLDVFILNSIREKMQMIVNVRQFEKVINFFETYLTILLFILRFFHV